MNEHVPPFLGGYFLIAETELKDPDFTESIVLLVHHDKEGAMGLVINQETDLNLGETTGDAMSPLLGAYPLFIGGPVDREYLLVLHTGFPGGERSKDSILLGAGIVFEPDFKLVNACIERYAGDQGGQQFHIRFYSGYSGWSAGQLETELASDSWILLPASPDLVFSATPRRNWIEALKRKGGIHWVYAKSGYKPSMN